jgi:phage terminase large subunit
MATAQIQLPPKLKPVFLGKADIRGAHGGRGSAKSRSFAKMTAVRAYVWSKAGREGIILCGRQFMNSLSDSSLEEVKAAIRSEPWLLAHFEIGEQFVRTKDGRIAYSFTGLARNLDSIKSKSRILLAWIEEGEQVTEEAWVKLIPTLREEDSELWVTWNPENDRAPTNKRFHTRIAPPDARMKIVEMNWRDNPWFPDILERQRVKDKAERPDSYDHVWEGDFVRAVEGSYYAKCLTRARDEGRIGFVAEEPNLIVRLHADIGGTGAKSDNFVFWAQQCVGTEIRWVNHYEQQGQPIASHLNWMREQGYTPNRCKIWLPHDGDTQDRVFDVSYRTAFEAAGYEVVVVPNQGKGAASKRIEEGRRLFPRMRFDAEKCSAGLKALGWYHEKRDEERGIGLGPDHDWSSHSADAFGTGCVAYEEPQNKIEFNFANGAGFGG